MRGEIASLTLLLAEKGIITSVRIAQLRKSGAIFEVGWSEDGPNIAPALKNAPYSEIYTYLSQNRQYNFMLKDGSLIQLLYRFTNRILVEQRVCYYPVPKDFRDESRESDERIEDLDLEMTHPSFAESDAEQHEEVTYSEIPVIRIDYSPERHKAISHAAAHLHLGHTTDCRIPTSAPIAPYAFVLFILRCFYSKELTPELEKQLTTPQCFSESIVKAEKACVYLNVPTK